MSVVICDEQVGFLGEARVQWWFWQRVGECFGFVGESVLGGVVVCVRGWVCVVGVWLLTWVWWLGLCCWRGFDGSSWVAGMVLEVGVGLQIQFINMNPKKFLNFPLSPLSNSHLKSLDLNTKSLVDERETFSLLGISSQSIFSFHLLFLV